MGISKSIQKKFTILVIVLMFFQICLSASYLAFQWDYIFGYDDNPSEVTLTVLKFLFAFEIMIGSSVIFARQMQNKQTKE